MNLLMTIIRILGYPSFELISQLPRCECLRRLRDHTGQEQSTWRFSVGGATLAESAPIAGQRSVIGRIGDTELRIRKRIEEFNSFQSHLFAEIADSKDGTWLFCRVGVHPLVVAFVAFWFIGVVWFCYGFFLEGDDARATFNVFGVAYAIQGRWVAALIPLLFVGFGVGIVKYCHYLARDEQAFLIDFLRDTIGAQKV
jgi:hypothetical protein